MAKLPKAKKHLGQHFLQDSKVINGITQDWFEEAEVIIEIGPGPGVLTANLSAHNKPFFVIEKDESMEEYLLPHVAKENIFFQDALEFNWHNFLTKHDLQNKKIWLVSNLPYNVGTVLFTQFLQVPQIQFMTLMFQKEVGDKTYLKQENNQMNGLLFLSLNYFLSKKLLKVLPGAFNPPPKVDSVVVSYERKTDGDFTTDEFPELNKFCRALFAQKRKQLGKVLKQSYSPDKLQRAFEQSEVSPQRRAETLTFQEVSSLFSFLK